MPEDIKKLLSDTIDTITNVIDGDSESFPELSEINERLWNYYSNLTK